MTKKTDMPKRLKYGFPIAMILLVISRLIEMEKTVSAALLFGSTLIMFFSISKLVMDQKIHIRLAIILLFILQLIGIGSLMLPISLNGSNAFQFIGLMILVIILIAFIALSFLLEKIKLYIQLKRMEK